MTDVRTQVKRDTPPFAFNPADAEFRRDPYPRYDELREDPKLARTEDGMWVLTRHADVLAAVRDPRLSSHPRHAEGRRRERRNTIPFLGDGSLEIMLVADAPDHTRLRRLADKAFTPRAVEAMRPRIVEIVDELLDAAVSLPGTGFDVMDDLAEPLRVIVICELLGVPTEDQEQLKPWSTAIARMLDPDVDASMLQNAIPAVMGFVQYFQKLIEERRASPRDDLLSALIAAEAAGEKLSGAHTGRSGRAPPVRRAGGGDRPHRRTGGDRSRRRSLTQQIPDGARRGGVWQTLKVLLAPTL